MGILHDLPWPFNSRAKSISVPDASPNPRARHDRAAAPAETTRARGLSVLGAGIAFHFSLRTPEPASEGPLARPDPTPVPASKYRGPRRRALDGAGSRSLGPSRRKQARPGLGPASASFGGMRLGRTPRRSLEGAPHPREATRGRGETRQGAHAAAQDAFDSMLHTWKVALADEFSNILNDSVICEMSSKGIVLETVVASKQVQVDHRREILLTAILRWGASGEYFAFSVRQPNSAEGIEDVYLRGPHKQIAQMEATFVALVSEYVRAARREDRAPRSQSALPAPSSPSRRPSEHASPSPSGWGRSPLRPSPRAEIRSTHRIDAGNAPSTPPRPPHVPIHVGIRTLEGGASAGERSGMLRSDENEARDAGRQAPTQADVNPTTTPTTAAEKSPITKKWSLEPVRYGLDPGERGDASMRTPQPEAGDSCQTQSGSTVAGAVSFPPPEADKPQFQMEHRTSGLVILRPVATRSPESPQRAKTLQLTIPPPTSESDDSENPVVNVTPVSHANLFTHNSPLSSRRATPPPFRSPVPGGPASSPLSVPSSLLGGEPETVRVSWRAVNSLSDPRTTPRTFGDDAGADPRLADCGVVEALSGVRRQVSREERAPTNRGRETVSPARSAGWRGGEGAHPRHSARPSAAAMDAAPPPSPQGWGSESSVSGRGAEPRRRLELDSQSEFGNLDPEVEGAGTGQTAGPDGGAGAGAGWPIAGYARGAWDSHGGDTGGTSRDMEAARETNTSVTGTTETDEASASLACEPGPAAPRPHGTRDFVTGQHPSRDAARLAESTDSIPFTESTESLLSCPAPDHTPTRGPHLAQEGWSSADAARGAASAVAAFARKSGGAGMDNTDAHSGTGSLVTLCHTWNTASELSQGGGTVGGANSSATWNAGEQRRARQPGAQTQAAEPQETGISTETKGEARERPQQSLDAPPNPSSSPCMVGVAVHAPSPIPPPAPLHGSLLGVSLAAIAPTASSHTSRRHSSHEIRLDLSCSPAPRKAARHSSHEVYPSHHRSQAGAPMSPPRKSESKQRGLRDTVSSSPRATLVGQDRKRATRSSRTREGSDSDADADMFSEIEQYSFKKGGTGLLCVSTKMVQVYENTEFDAHNNPTYDVPESPNSAADEIAHSKFDLSDHTPSSLSCNRSVAGSRMRRRNASASKAHTGMASSSCSARKSSASSSDGSFKGRSSQALINGSKGKVLTGGGSDSVRRTTSSRGIAGFMISSQRNKPNSQPTHTQQTNSENTHTSKHYLTDTVSSARQRQDTQMRKSMEGTNAKERGSTKPPWKT
mmetsp:Transcript_25041/g.47581  ORF Transcript_25041/g.47581 Transcript_25041/m.47581 type:complete len:1286 (-) Transcript_25041:192-4049(-)